MDIEIEFFFFWTTIEIEIKIYGLFLNPLDDTETLIPVFVAVGFSFGSCPNINLASPPTSVNLSTPEAENFRHREKLRALVVVMAGMAISPPLSLTFSSRTRNATPTSYLSHNQRYSNRNHTLTRFMLVSTTASVMLLRPKVSAFLLFIWLLCRKLTRRIVSALPSPYGDSLKAGNFETPLWLFVVVFRWS